MLQVITGQYFRDVPLYTTKHRVAVYTNAHLSGSLDSDGIADYGIASVVYGSSWSDSGAAWLTVTERLEAVQEDGSDEFMLSTGGSEVVADLCDVLSFAHDLTFSTDASLVERLVSSGPSVTSRRSPTVRRAFDPAVVLEPDDIAEAREFVDRLLAMSRRSYEQAMRAIRRVVRARERLIDEPTLAYTDYVAALEALSAGFDPPGFGWENLDGRKRKVLDPVLASLTETQREQVRQAILEAERAGARLRFVSFVLEHLEPDFFGVGAAESPRPIPSWALRRALDRAYAIRSESLHSLKELRPEALVLSDLGADHITPADQDPMLTHEGLHRIAQHVIRSFVERAPEGIDPDFVYRDHLPNVVRVRLAPELFMGYPANLTKETAHEWFSELASQFLSVQAGRLKGLPVDMRPALSKGLTLLNQAGTPPDVKRALVAMEVLWDRLTDREIHLSDSPDIVNQSIGLLVGPSVESFIVAIVLKLDPNWSVDEWCELAEERFENLGRRRPWIIPDGFDAALWVVAARALATEGGQPLVAACVQRAIECLPGDPRLLTLVARPTLYALWAIDVRDLALVPHPREAEQSSG